MSHDPKLIPRPRYDKTRPSTSFARGLDEFADAMMTRGMDRRLVAEAARRFIDLWLDEWAKDDHPHARPGRVAPAPY